MSPTDQRLVRSWRNLGCDWCDAVLNAGVMGRRRVSPTDAVHEAHAALLSEYVQRRTLEGVPRARRKAALHEAGHAIVGAALGYPPKAISIEDDGTGSCLAPGAPPFEEACVLLAGEVQVDLFERINFAEGGLGGCERDRRAALALLGDDALAEARARCVGILRTRQDEVHRLTDQLVAESTVVY